MKYMTEYTAGYHAGKDNLAPSDNPHIWKCPQWWAWHAGWEAGRADVSEQFTALLSEIDPHPIRRA